MRLTGVAAIVGAVMVMAAGAADAQVGGNREGGPSFACESGKTLGEQILCSDPALAARDLQMAEAYKAKLRGPEADAVKAAQKAWLKQRDTACNLAGKKAQETLDLAEVWKAAPCLVKQYDARLAELGAKAPDLVPLPTGAWHPACVGAAVEAPDQGIDLTLCQAGTAHIPATETGDTPDAFETEGLFDGFPDYNFYEKIGTLPDGRALLLTTYNGGGTGFFSLVSVATVKKGADGHDWLTMKAVGDGGDRCNGGISEARLTGTSVSITRNLTPAALASVLKVPEPVVTQLPDCAACCAGEVTTHQTVDGTPQVDRVTVADLDEMALGDGKLEACVSKALDSAAGKSLKLTETAALSKAIAACEKYVVK